MTGRKLIALTLLWVTLGVAGPGPALAADLVVASATRANAALALDAALREAVEAAGVAVMADTLAQGGVLTRDEVLTAAASVVRVVSVEFASSENGLTTARVTLAVTRALQDEAMAYREAELRLPEAKQAADLKRGELTSLVKVNPLYERALVAGLRGLDPAQVVEVVTVVLDSVGGQWPTGHAIRGVAYLRQGRLALAKADLDAAGSDPSEPLHHYGLARLFEGRGRRRQAATEYEAFVAASGAGATYPEATRRALKFLSGLVN